MPSSASGVARATTARCSGVRVSRVALRQRRSTPPTLPLWNPTSAWRSPRRPGSYPLRQPGDHHQLRGSAPVCHRIPTPALTRWWRPGAETPKPAVGNCHSGTANQPAHGPGCGHGHRPRSHRPTPHSRTHHPTPHCSWPCPPPDHQPDHPPGQYPNHNHPDIKNPNITTPAAPAANPLTTTTVRRQTPAPQAPTHEKPTHQPKGPVPNPRADTDHHEDGQHHATMRGRSRPTHPARTKRILPKSSQKYRKIDAPTTVVDHK